MPGFTLDGFKLDLRHNDRVNEIFDAYRIKLTGSLECRKENRIYDFIYRENPRFTSEILMIMYQVGYEDGRKEVMMEAEPMKTKQKQDRKQDYLDWLLGGKTNLRLVVDNTKRRRCT